MLLSWAHFLFIISVSNVLAAGLKKPPKKTVKFEAIMHACVSASGYLLFKSADNALWDGKTRKKKQTKTEKPLKTQKGTRQRIIMKPPFIAVNFSDTAAGGV